MKHLACGDHTPGTLLVNKTSGNHTSNKLQVSDKILVVSAHVCLFSIEPTTHRRFRFPLVTTLIYTEPTVTNKETVLLNAKV